MPVLPRTYFYFVGAFALFLALVFIIYKFRSDRHEELFPYAQSIPTLLILREGQVVARQVGALPAEALLAWVRRAIR